MTPQIIATFGPIDRAETLRGAHAAIVKAGYDGVYLPQSPGLFEPLEMAGYMAACDTSALKYFVTQRTGLIAPTMCSRMFATLDQLTQGRIVAVLDAESDTNADGDTLDATQRIPRALEYGRIMRNLWSADKPLDHAGTHYAFNKGRTNVPPLQKGALPLLMQCAPDVDIAGSAFDGVILSGPQTADSVARFVAQKLVVAVVVEDAPEQTIATYAKAGASTFIIAASHADLSSQFVERCRAAATPKT
ncbi:MAG: LLM class flavin-dependent oxidoreductase [Rhodospirillaceae bacterium]|nr:LLM class flavin-dependent oxidoreductase [Rhodospirillaceae bacterium]